MMASLLSAVPPAGRTDMSQLLPTVKCSNCNRPVPLNDLSDHVCAAPPTLPKPTLSPAAAVSLLPQRLQDRLVSPASPRTFNDARLGGTSSSDRLRIDTGSTYQSRPSQPAASNEADRAPSPYQRSLLNPSPTPSFTSVSTLPLRARAGTVAGTLGRRPSNFSATSYNPPPVSSPATARPSFPSSRDAGSSYNPGAPPRKQLPSPPRDPSLRATPAPQNVEPDTQTGGAAGMAGVGRRGFAAAARAAMFLPTPGDQLLVPQPCRNNAAPYLDTDLPRHINETPPLSAGSGNTSQSPDVSPYPQSPVGHHGVSYPDRQVPPSHQVTPSLDTGLPLRKMPFGKGGNQLASVIPKNNTLEFDNRGPETPSTAKQQPFPSRSRESETSISLYNHSATTRSVNNSTNASRLAARRPPSSSDSASDYDKGLAYADNTDHEDEETPGDAKAKGKAHPPPPLPLHGILRSTSSSSMNHVHFRSSVEPVHQRKSSVSSLSSSGGDDVRRSNSAAIAHALGLSQTASGSYARLGGPGAQMGRRGRSGTSASLSSEGSRVSQSRGGLGTSGSSLGTMEKELKILMEEREERVDGVEERDRRAGLSKSMSTGRQRTFTAGEGQASGAWAPLSAKNSRVVGSLKRSDKETEKRVAIEPKMPTRAKSSTESMGGSGKKERTKKLKVCLKCNGVIENGRWIAMEESGGVLCERCWKHMYLPKCRRCKLPIENAAVSSADGQLRGKYHRECFNCHVCHKSFPDKSFYVFDGKPLCKYHYHEANESLCAAALCGQPIEGPCAVSHTGDRYHPEHMLCEYPGNPPCKTKLAEYWEVDGRMLCERHAHTSEVESDDERGEEEWVQSSKRMKRVTRYIDLAGGLPSGGLR